VDTYAAIIVGAGPAGIFAALTLSDNGVSPILIVEKGGSIEERLKSRKPDILTGWGGAGAFSDGKLTLSPEVGGFLGEFMPNDRLARLLKKADKVWVDFGAPGEVFDGDPEEISDMKIKARLAGMIFVPSPVRHIGTDNCHLLLARIQEHLNKRADIKTSLTAANILTKDGKAAGVEMEDGGKVYADTVIVAPGRVGNKWMRGQAERLGLDMQPNPVDIGVRVEAPGAVLTGLTDTFYESKLIHYTTTFDDKVRTFCMNPFGEVVAERSESLISVNGHSYANKRTDNTNFALLVSASFTEPFDDPIAYGRSITKLANLVGGGVLVQRYGDLKAGRRSTPDRIARSLTRPTLKDATPGDLAYVLPHRICQDIIEMIEAMDKITPGLADRHTLLYGIEVKFYSQRVKLDKDLMTQVDGLYIIGDGAGITRGLLQASVSGMVAAEAALKKM
jgi:uncharacterized FAD-dependent dehydrogenase